MELNVYKWTIKIESCVDHCYQQSWIIAALCWTWTGTTSKVEQC